MTASKPESAQAQCPARRYHPMTHDYYVRCVLPAGHEGEHANVDLSWADDSKYAIPPAPAPPGSPESAREADKLRGNIEAALRLLLKSEKWVYRRAAEVAIEDLATLAAALAGMERLEALLRRALAGEPWSAFANDGSGRTFEDEVREALAPPKDAR